MGSSTSKHAITSSDKAILDLKTQRDRLQKYQIQIARVSEREMQIARICLERGDKERALLALRKKKYQQQLISQTNEQLLTIQNLMQTIEFSLIQKDVLNGLQKGNQVLATLNKETNIQDVENLLSDTAEAIDIQNQISELLQGSLTSENEQSALEEFNLLEQAAIDKFNLENLPSVPGSSPKIISPLKIANNAEHEPDSEAEADSTVKPELIPA